ncbi:MAG: glycosyltransferase [Pseudomonadota bacterium]
MSRRLAILINSHPYFHQHKEALFRDLPADVDVTLHTGECDPGISPDFAGQIRPLAIDRYAHFRFGDFRALRQMFQVFRHDRPDIVVAITLKVVLFALLAGALSRWTGRPCSKIVLFFPGLGRVFGSRKGGLFNKLRLSSSVAALRMLTGQGNCAFVFENETDQRLFVALSIADRDATKVISGTGVPIDVHVPAKDPDGPLRVAFAGRVLRAKGVELLIRAFKGLGEQEPVQLDIYGPSDPSDPDSVPLQAADLPSTIRYHGAVPLDGVYEALGEAHCVCLPTLYREGLPRILLEGAAHACALISTNMPGCRSIVKDGVTGRLILARDPAVIEDDLVRTLRAFAHDRSGVIAMGQRARELLLDGDFSEQAVRDAFQAFILQ